MQTTSPMAEKAARPEVSVYWKPGCSSCLKAKEFVEENGIFYESVNVVEDTDAMDEIMAAGLRSIPVVRRGDKYVYAQSLDDVAELLEVTRNHQRLTQDQLLERWDAILDKATVVIESFTEEQLRRNAITGRDRPIKDLCSHVFQVVEAFMAQLKDDTIDARALGADARKNIVTRADLLAYIKTIHANYRAWLAAGGAKSIPDRMVTYYGNQPSGQVLERGVWHSTQHTRQLDYVAAGMGAELQVPTDLYEGLPLPKRLWA